MDYLARITFFFYYMLINLILFLFFLQNIPSVASQGRIAILLEVQFIRLKYYIFLHDKSYFYQD